jgi:hypothetical protein
LPVVPESLDLTFSFALSPLRLSSLGTILWVLPELVVLEGGPRDILLSSLWFGRSIPAVRCGSLSLKKILPDPDFFYPLGKSYLEFWLRGLGFFAKIRFFGFFWLRFCVSNPGATCPRWFAKIRL